MLAIMIKILYRRNLQYRYLPMKFFCRSLSYHSYVVSMISLSIDVYLLSFQFSFYLWDCTTHFLGCFQDQLFHVFSRRKRPCESEDFLTNSFDIISRQCSLLHHDMRVLYGYDRENHLHIPAIPITLQYLQC